MKKWAIYSKFRDKNDIVAGTTLKDSNYFCDFSLALHTGQDREGILKNREEFMKRFNKSFKFVSLNQVHSSRVVDIDDIELKERWSELNLEADGFVTSKPNLILNILTADCIALLAYDSKKKIIGAAHAGWRGSRGNIAKSLIDKMKAIGANPKDIIVAISPSIRGCCYEVNEEIASYFKEYPQAIRKEKDRVFLDISIINRVQLLEEGIEKNNIEVSAICTSCSVDSYFSYRKESGCKGRFISFIGMK